MSQTDTEFGTLLGVAPRQRAAENLALGACPRISWAVGEGGRDGLEGSNRVAIPSTLGDWETVWLRGPRKAGSTFPFFCSPCHPQAWVTLGSDLGWEHSWVHIPPLTDAVCSQTLRVTSPTLRFPREMHLICGSQSCFVAAGWLEWHHCHSDMLVTFNLSLVSMGLWHRQPFPVFQSAASPECV